MAAMDKAIKREFIRYTKKHYPDEAEKIIRRAEKMFPVLYAKAPDIGGKPYKCAVAHNLGQVRKLLEGDYKNYVLFS